MSFQTADNDYARNITWGLEPSPSLLIPLAPAENSGEQYRERTSPANMRAPAWRWTYSSPAGQVVTGMAVIDVIPHLFLNIDTGQVFWSCDLSWWNSHRTERAISYGIRLRDEHNVICGRDAPRINPLAPTYYIWPFITDAIDCTCIDPGKSWYHQESMIALIDDHDAGKPLSGDHGREIYNRTRYVEFVFENPLPGDHGTYCH